MTIIHTRTGRQSPNRLIGHQRLRSVDGLDESLRFPALRLVADAAHHVGGDCLVDFLGVGEVEVGHDGSELFHGLRKAGVVLLLLEYGAAVPPLKTVQDARGELLIAQQATMYNFHQSGWDARERSNVFTTHLYTSPKAGAA